MTDNKAFDPNYDVERTRQGGKAKDFLTIDFPIREKDAGSRKGSKVDNYAKEVTIEDALHAAGNGKFSIYIVLTAGLVLYSVNSELYSIGYVIPTAECDLKMNLWEKSTLVTVQSIGMILTQFFWGFVSDAKGRRNVMFWTILLTGLCTVASVFSPNFWMLVFFRFLNGVFVSAPNALIFAYVGEFFSEKYRSVYLIITSSFIGIAFTLFPTVALLIIPLDINIFIFNFRFTSWRLYMLLSGLAAVPACLLLYLLPESPKFLAQANQNHKALEVVARIYKSNHPKKASFPIYKLLETETSRQKESQIFAIFKWKYLLNTMLVFALQIGIFAASSGLYLWYPDIVQRISKHPQHVTVCHALDLPNMGPNNETVVDTHCQTGKVQIDSNVYTQNIFIGAAYTTGYIAISFMLKFMGIKIILALFLGVSGLATFILHWISNKLVIDALFMGTLVLSGLCVAVVNTAVVEIYPTNLRGLAVCFAMVAGRFGSIISSSVVGYLLEWNCDATFFIYSASLLACSFLALFLRMPSTKTENLNKKVKS